tara:strand:+ start:609 stop:929 length:321 start_codon:yes stop_codon:yes gene_type:complete
MAGIGFGTNFNNDNYKVTAGNGLGPVTRICTIVNTGQTQAELDSAIQALTAGVTVANVDYPGGTVAASTALADTVHIALQGGVAPEGSAGTYTAATTVTVVATFTD